MFTKLAALGVGLMTVAAAPAALAQVPYGPVYTGANYPTVVAPPVPYGVPVPAVPVVYGPAPVPVYTPGPVYTTPGPVYTTPGPVYTTPGPEYAPPQRGRDRNPVSVRRADFNYDGGITFAEAYAYGRNEFARADMDRNGVLTRREMNYRYDEIANGARRRDGVVTFAEYDQSLRSQFAQLDRNRDGFLSRRELGTDTGRPPVVTFNWHWEL